MSERHSDIKLTYDVVARKVFSNEAFTAKFIKEFLKIEVESCELLDSHQLNIDKDLKNKGSETVLDILAKINDTTYVIIEIQMYDQFFFINRFMFYIAKEIVDKHDEIMKNFKKAKDVYAKLKPVYAIAIVDKLNLGFSDEYPIKSFTLRDERTNEPLLTPVGEEQVMLPPLKIVMIELGHFTGFEDINDSEKAFLEFFTNRPFTTEIDDVIKEADRMVDRSTWSEEENELYDYEQRMKENYELGLDAAKRKGIEQGHIQTLIELLQDGLLTEEIVCERLKISKEELKTLVNSMKDS